MSEVTLQEEMLDDFVIAAGQGEKWKVEDFLRMHADLIDAESALGHTALTWAAESRQQDMMELLLDKGADIDKRDSHGKTALIYAAQSNNQDMAEFLLNRGANVGETGKDGKTALVYAKEQGIEKMIALLDQEKWAQMQEARALAKEAAEFSPALKRDLPVSPQLKLRAKP
jgi:ankyrin repeat protein